MRFGFGAYTWQMSSDRYLGRVDHIADVVSECGGEGVEAEVCMLGDYMEDPLGLRELLGSRGLSLAALCYVEEWRGAGETCEERERATRVIDCLSHFPGSLLQLAARSAKDRSDLRERQQGAIRCLNDLAGRAADRGIPCAVHPSSPLGSAFRTREDYEILLGGLDSSLVGFVPDTGHIIRAAMDPLEVISTYRSLVRHVHLRDVSSSGEWVEMGKGLVDFPALVSYLTGTGYAGWAIVDEESASSKRDPDAAARRNAAYLHNTLAPVAR